MLILAFDTATEVATSALVDDGEVLGERSSTAKTLLADLDALLRQAGAHAGDVDGHRCRHGPGELHRHADRARGRARVSRSRSVSRRRRLDARRAGAGAPGRGSR